MLDITPQKRRHSSTGSEVSGNEWIASSSKAGTTALTREDYGFTGTTPDGNNFTIYFNTLQRSRLLYDIYTEQEEECLVPVCTSQFLAWVNYVQLGPSGFGADDLSGYITIKSITDALRVADYVADQDAVISACDSFSELIFELHDHTEVLQDLKLAPKSGPHFIKRRKQELGFAGYFSQDSHSIPHSDPLFLQLLERVGKTWMKKHAYTTRLCSNIDRVYCPGYEMPITLLPVFIMRLPAELRTLAIRAMAPGVSSSHILHLPHLKDDFFAPMISAAAHIPQLTSVDVTIDCTCCDVVKECRGHGPDDPKPVRRAIEELSVRHDITSFSVRISKTSRDFPKKKVCQDFMCFASFMCEPVLAGIGSLSALSRLELHGFSDPDDILPGSLKQLKHLRILRLVRCSLRSAAKNKAKEGVDEAAKWRVPDALRYLRNLEELDLSRNHISKFHFKRLTAVLVRLPVRSLVLADCMLNIWNSLSIMGDALKPLRNGSIPRFANLSRLDMSGNTVRVKSEFKRDVPNQRAQRVLVQLSGLVLGRVVCPWKSMMEHFLEQLEPACVGLEEFSVGRVKEARGRQMGLRSIIQKWTNLRVLHVDWAVPATLLSMVGKSRKYLGDLSRLEDLHLGNLSVGRGIRPTLLEGMKFPLTRLVLTNLMCSGRGAAALSSWIAMADSLRVLHIEGMARLYSDRKRRPHVETAMLEGVQRLTSLRELKLRWYVNFSHGGDALRVLTSALVALTQLSSLDIKLPPSAVGHMLLSTSAHDCKVMIARLTELSGLEHLSLYHVPMESDGVTELVNTVKALPALKSLDLWQCLPEVEGNEHEIRTSLASGATLRFEKVDQPNRLVDRNEDRLFYFNNFLQGGQNDGGAGGNVPMNAADGGGGNGHGAGGLDLGVGAAGQDEEMAALSGDEDDADVLVYSNEAGAAGLLDAEFEDDLEAHN